MTLLFDKRAELDNQPGFHAFIVGVSAYPHLPGGGGAPADEDFDLQQLSSTALSAYQLYKWIVEHQDRLPRPLATCRLLLSPSPDEKDVEPALAGLAAPATRREFIAEAKGWRTDASTHRENMTLFYFAGHGVQRSKEDQVMLLEDFGDPGAGGILTNTVESINLFYGMTSSESRPDIAQTQLYFIDACRVAPSQFSDFERLVVPSIWDIEAGGVDDRFAPIFYAAVPGTLAYARKRQQTVFCQELLACLQGAAARPVNEDATGKVTWGVSINSLNDTLQGSFKKINDEKGITQDFDLGGHSKNTVICYLDKPPSVDIVLEIDPSEALPLTTIEVRNAFGKPVLKLRKIDPHPFQQSLEAGIYTITGKVKPHDPPRFEDYIRSRQVLPPSSSWKVKVAP